MPDDPSDGLKRLVVTEAQLEVILKKFLEQYAGVFDHVTFDEDGGGYLVHFHMQPTHNSFGEVHSSEPDSGYMPPISIPIPDFGLGGGFGGFGGGSSGGAGASGGW